MKKKEGYIVWTVYFDSEKSWSEGRRVPRSLSVERPSVEEVAEAARAAGYKVVAVEPDKRYPAWWFEEGGRVIVHAEDSKNKVVYEIARKLVEIKRRRAGAKRKKRRR